MKRPRQAAANAAPKKTKPAKAAAKAGPKAKPAKATTKAASKTKPVKAARKSKPEPKLAGSAASKLISQRIAKLGGWRGETLAKLRTWIREADPEVIEEWKWMGTPCWYHDGGICTGESYKSVVKLTFFKGASLKDPSKLFNSSLGGNLRRAIDIREGERLNEKAFKALIRAAIARNALGTKKSAKS
jgi:hypothetical protein